jgi:nucleotide-binding universal stress UspA family protein
MVRAHLDRLAAHHVPAEGQILLHAADHGAAGRMVAEYANGIGADTIVVGAPSHGGLAALMDGSASRELWRHARSNVLVVNPDAPGTRDGRPDQANSDQANSDRADAELLRG